MSDNQDPQARIWEVERRTGGPTSYFIVIVDGDKDIACEIKHDPATNSFTADAYLPQDYDYTLHDGCDHENGDCVCDTEEYQQQEWMDTKMSLAVHKLRQAELQLKQAKIAERLSKSKRSV